MLKVVGASWLQTRISTYILVAVALLGIGAIILSEYGQWVGINFLISLTILDSQIHWDFSMDLLSNNINIICMYDVSCSLIDEFHLL